ncbi:MAG: hypothetical protein KJO26_13740 [Deltaproteobacteria bacterium]|nr:hypothetical protein [Deltaproteobacteria bacterium]
MCICDFDIGNHLEGVRKCFVELQDFERSLDPRMPPGAEIVDTYIPYMLNRCKKCGGKILVADVNGEVAGFVTILTKVKSDDIEEGDNEVHSKSLPCSFGYICNWSLPVIVSTYRYWMISRSVNLLVIRYKDSGKGSYWHSYIAVVDVYNCAKQASVLGGKVIVPPHDVPDVGRICVVSDPTDAVVHLMQPIEG